MAMEVPATGWRTTHPRAVALAVLLVLVLVAAGSLPSRALAHPLGNFTINRYARLELYEGTLRIHYSLDYAEIPSIQVVEDADADGDGALSAPELDAWAAMVAPSLAGGIELTAGDEPLPLRFLDARASTAEGQAGLKVVRFDALYEAAVGPAAGPVPVSFTDQNFKDRPGWREVAVRPSAGSEVSIEPALLDEMSNGLTAYPENSLADAPSEASASFTWAPASGSRAPLPELSGPGGGRATRSGGGFASLLENDRSLGLIVFSLLAAFGFGALHALGPGHGKSVVAAYLVGSRGTARHALALGMTVTATHTSTVYVLAFVTLAASQFIVPEQLYLYLGVGSGALVVLMGLGLLWTRLRRATRGAAAAHQHGLFGRPHSHLPDTAEHEHEHQDAEHEHAHAHPHAAPARVGWRGLLTLGVAGGLLPCPSAIVVMLAAISLGQVLFGMLLIVAFSLGLAGVLMAIGLALVWGRRLSGRTSLARAAGHPLARRALAAFPVLTAAGLTFAGVMITYQAWSQPGL